MENSLKKSILKSDLPKIIETAGELSLDSIIDDGLLKDIPILNTLLAIGKTWGNIKDFLFAQKMLKFLKSISELTEIEREKLINKLDNDKNFGEHTGVIIVELLSKLDSEIKPVLVANAFKMYAKGEIDSAQLQRINNAIDRFLLCDIEQLYSFCQVDAKPFTTDGNPVTVNFLNAGLAFVQSGYGGGGIHPTETAKFLIKIFNQSTT